MFMIGVQVHRTPAMADKSRECSLKQKQSEPLTLKRKRWVSVCEDEEMLGSSDFTFDFAAARFYMKQ